MEDKTHFDNIALVEADTGTTSYVRDDDSVSTIFNSAGGRATPPASQPRGSFSKGTNIPGTKSSRSIPLTVASARTTGSQASKSAKKGQEKGIPSRPPNLTYLASSTGSIGSVSSVTSKTVNSAVSALEDGMAGRFSKMETMILALGQMLPNNPPSDAEDMDVARKEKW